MLRLAAEQEELGVVDDQRGCPAFARDLAEGVMTVVDRLAEQPPESPWGVYHLTGAGDTTWCGFAKAIMAGSASRGGPSAHVNPITTADYPTPVTRPADSRLDCTRIETVYGIKPRLWNYALDQALDEILGAEKELRP